MPINNQTDSEENLWPPTFASCTDYSTRGLMLATEQELNRSKVPDTYKAFMQSIHEELKDIEENKQLIKRLTDKANLYNTYVKSTEQTYNALVEIHKEERKRGDTLEENIFELNEKIKKMQSDTLLRETEIKNMLIRMKDTYLANLAQQKEDFAKISNKQANGRKNIEETLIVKELELTEIKKKFSDAEFQLNEKQKELDKCISENQQLRVLLGYLQNPGQMPRQPIQQQQQQQQHIQPQTHPYQ